MEYRKHVSMPWFGYIKCSRKTVEGRLNKGDFAQFKPGDIVIWFNSELKQEFKTQVIYKKNYSSFKEMICKEGLANVLPEIKTVDAGVAIYHQYYTPSDEKTYGVAAIRLKVL
jgi:ASC-1-like (ASCH) protein